MTKLIMDVRDDDSALYFECIMHVGDHDICTMVSTLCNVLVLRCDQRDYDVDIYNEGHVRINIERADAGTCAVARALLDSFMYLEEMYPDYVKVY